ncbi:MAG: transporter, partial [Gammaproteobacteria bacterium]|nr:transporter [Gammaproteobacteria bacterium]
MPGFRHLYESIVLGRPAATLVVVALFTIGFGWYAQFFSLDASADSLTLEHDEGLDYYRYVRARYGSDDYLIITYTPADDLFSDATLSDIRALRDDLEALANVESVTTILDVPLVL